MFTWICPQCGAEVPPSYDQCPKCAENAKEQEQAATAVPAPPAPPAPVAAPVHTTPPPQYQPQPQYQPLPAHPVRPGPPGWLVTLGVFGVLAALGVGLYWWTNRTDSPSSASAPVAEARPAIKMETPQAAKQEPTPTGAQLAKHLEAVGIRFTEEKRRTSVTVTVVNHSNAEMVALDGSIKISTKDGSKEVTTVQFKMPNLGPHEAKDYSIPMLTTMRAYELPDWQFLKAEIILK